MRCLLCGKETAEGQTLWEALSADDLLCGNCRRAWTRQDLCFRLEGIEVRTSYLYEGGFRDCILQYKECGDEALQEVFLRQVKDQLKHRYRGYTLALMPSSARKTEERGFHHLRQMFSCLELPMIEPFEKTGGEEQKQLSRAGRERMSRGLRLIRTNLPRKILLADDIITTGSTLRGALHCLEGGRRDIRIYACAAHPRWTAAGRRGFRCAKPASPL